MVIIVDTVANIVWVGYLFCAFKASFNYYQKLLDILSHPLPQRELSLYNIIQLEAITS